MTEPIHESPTLPRQGSTHPSSLTDVGEVQHSLQTALRGCGMRKTIATKVAAALIILGALVVLLLPVVSNRK